MGVAEGNVGVAFALTIAAGLSTTLGASFVFCARRANRNFLAVSLGASAGVMLYVSFYEIFAKKAVKGFEDSGHDNKHAQLYATLCFFGGIGATALLDKLVHLVAHTADEQHHEGAGEGSKHNSDAFENPFHEHHYHHQVRRLSNAADEPQQQQQQHQPPFSSPTAEVEVAVRGSEEAAFTPQATPRAAPIPPVCVCKAKVISVVQMPMTRDSGVELSPEEVGTHASCPQEATTNDDGAMERRKNDAERKRLEKMGLMTGFAIFLHNFPEGLATFVAALSSTNVGVAIAIAIALHNIPEGVCVALPIYYASGSRWKGFMWSFLSGVSEPVGALIGWLILARVMSDLVYGILFGVVAGVMVFIALRELLPTAHRCDPTDKYVTSGVVFGMVVIALSLILFLF